MHLAVSRPRNLRDLLCKTDLPIIPGQDATDIQNKLEDRSTKDIMLFILIPRLQPCNGR
jgi:hypothetical protein